MTATEFPFSELISLAEAVGIIATLFVIFYFLRREMRDVSIDIETKVLNDLDEKIHAMGEMTVHKPELIKLINKNQTNQSPELVFAYYILYICVHAFHMQKRNVLRFQYECRKISHILGRVHHPQTNGKIERFYEAFQSKMMYFESIEEFITWYNTKGPHMSLNWDELETPIQAFFTKVDNRRRKRLPFIICR